MEMSKELQSTISAPDVVAQLKSMVTQMQRELGDQEVVVTRVLGSGGSGVVYQGTWRGLTVAVKTLVFTVLPMQPMTRRQQRAMTEAAICRTLHHPNIVATYAYELQSLQALGSQFCNGGTLRSAVDEGMLHDMSGGTPRPVMSFVMGAPYAARWMR
ncbi:protein kinase domain-containing protein, partial [Haematococcus lacustris]